MPYYDVVFEENEFHSFPDSFQSKQGNLKAYSYNIIIFYSLKFSDCYTSTCLLHMYLCIIITQASLAR